MSDNNSFNETTNADPIQNWNGVSSEAPWNDPSKNNPTVINNPPFDNSPSNNQTKGQSNNQTIELNTSDITEAYLTPKEKSINSNIANTSSNTNENSTNGSNNQNSEPNSNQVNNQPSNNLNNGNNLNTQSNGQTPQEIEIAPFTPEDAKPNDNEQQEVESVLPTKQDDASLKNQFKNSVSSEGKLSLRIAGVALVVIVLAVTYLAAKSSDPNKAVETKATTTKARPAKDLKSELKSNFSSPDMGTCPEPVNMAKESTPAPIETPPPVIINTPPEPPPIQAPVVSEPVVIQQEVEKPRQFAFRMRAGEESIKSYEQSLKPVAKEVTTNTVKVSIPRGTAIPLMMMQPFRNDIPTTVKCQITADVKTNKGEVLIPAGSIAFVPFSPFRNDKRVFNQVDRPATISIGEDQEIQLTGNAVDRSGGIGIQGKLIKRGDANIGKKIGRTMARVLTFGAAGAAGGVGGAVIAEAGSSAIDGSYVYTAPTDSYVEVPLGTIFFFNVSSNISSK